MAAAIWLTPAGDLGIIPELEYYELPLSAYNTTGGEPHFKLVSGSLPAGLELYDDGRVLGIPVLGQVRGVPMAVTRATTSTFTIRITNSENKVTDRTFSLTVAGILPPSIQPTSSSLGTFIDGNYVDVQLTAIEANPLLTPTFSLLGGTLPDGVVLTTAGRIYGYIRPISTSQTFTFTVQADDTVNTDVETYTIYVYSRTALTADNNIVTADLVGVVTSDLTSLYNPVLLTDSGSLGSIRQNTKVAIQLLAEDFDLDPISFQLVGGALPTGLMLNASTGWITGIVPYGSLGSVNYNFSVNVYKTNNTQYVSETHSYTLKVVGQISDTITWTTPSNLGGIYNGAISDLYVSAYTDSNRSLTYSLATIGSLPIGLSLQSDGTITGRVSFETFSLDGDTITFDNNLTTIDQAYVFTVLVSDNGNYVYDTKDFTIKVIKRDLQPYENLYIQALPEKEQRNIYDSLLNNSDIIPADAIYRQLDPWFGKNSLRRVLFQTGLNPKQVADYVSALELNHYRKTINFGQIKTAKAVDSNFNTVYEVVYVELLDRGVNDQGFGPNLAITWPSNTVGISQVYPNSFTNMSQRVAGTIGYENRSILPKWMTSRQNDGTVLGFTRCMVLVYTKPGRSDEIAYRISQEASKLNLIDFTIDRYEWDSSLSNNFTKAPAVGTGVISANTSSNVVVGVGSNFTNELLSAKTIYVNNVAIGNVNTITNSTTLTLTSNAISNVSANAYSYSTNVFLVNNFVYGAGTIIANTNSNVVIGITSVIAGSGNITGNSSSISIVGDSTSFNTELRVGKNLYYGGNLVGKIASIQSATSLRLTSPAAYTFTNVPFTADGVTTLFTTELHVGDTILTNANVILGTVKSINSDTNLVLYSNSLSTVSNVAFQHTDRDVYTVPGQGDQYLKFPQLNILA
jgi:hypothetical protein